MAAELATAGSIVGCIGLAGQVAQGCLFIWEFAETVRDSPHLVARLKEEIKLIKSISSSLERLIQDSSEGPMQNAEAAVTALKICATTIEELTELLSKYKGKKFRNLKMAARQKKVKGLTDRLANARSLISLAQSNMLMNKQHLEHKMLATIQVEQKANHQLNIGLMAALDRQSSESQRTQLEVKERTGSHSSDILRVLESNESQSAKLDHLLNTVYKGQENINTELGSMQEAVLVGLGRIQQLQQSQEGFRDGFSRTQKADSPFESVPTSKALLSDGATLMRVVDQQIIIRRSGKRELVACKDDEFEKATTTQKKDIVQILLLSRLVAHLSIRYGNMRSTRFSNDQVIFPNNISESQYSGRIQLPVCSGVCIWTIRDDLGQCSELKRRPNRLSVLSNTLLTLAHRSRANFIGKSKGEAPKPEPMTLDGSLMIPLDGRLLEPSDSTWIVEWILYPEEPKEFIDCLSFLSSRPSGSVWDDCFWHLEERVFCRVRKCV